MHISVKMLDGQRIERKFHNTDQLQVGTTIEICKNLIEYDNVINFHSTCLPLLSSPLSPPPPLSLLPTLPPLSLPPPPPPLSLLPTLPPPLSLSLLSPLSLSLSLQSLYDFAYSYNDIPKSFTLFTSYPKRELLCNDNGGPTLQELNFSRKVLVFVQNTTEDDE